MFLVRFWAFKLQESPRWLVSKKKDHLAVNSLIYIGNFNKKPTNLTLKQFHELDRIEATEPHPEGVAVPLGGFRQQWKNVKALFRGKDADPRLVLTIWGIYIFDFWGFSIVG